LEAAVDEEVDDDDEPLEPQPAATRATAAARVAATRMRGMDGTVGAPPPRPASARSTPGQTSAAVDGGATVL
jgi:hypothetical protein